MSLSGRRASRPGVPAIVGIAAAIVRKDLRILGVMLGSAIVGVIPVVGIILQILVGGIAIALAARTMADEPGTNTGLLPRLVALFVATLAAIIIVTFGLLLFILPGIYLSIRFVLVPAAIMVDDYDPVKAFRVSWDLTKGRHVTTVFGFLLLTGAAAFAILFLLYVLLIAPGPLREADTLWFRLLGAVVTTPLSAIHMAGLAVIYDAFER